MQALDSVAFSTIFRSMWALAPILRFGLKNSSSKRKSLCALPVLAVLSFGLSAFTVRDASAQTFILSQVSCTLSPFSGAWVTLTSTCTISSLTINSGNTVIIPTGTILASSGTIDNAGTINNPGTISNSGIIKNHGNIYNGGIITNPGTIDNDRLIITSAAINNSGGAIKNRSGACIQNNGKINNSGGEISNKGTIDNYVVILNSGTGDTIDNTSGITNNCGTIHGAIKNNAGTINNVGTIGAIKNNGGTTSNFPGGVIGIITGPPAVQVPGSPNCNC